MSQPFASELEPLAAWVSGRRRDAADRAFVLGISGAQGSGKSTLAESLARRVGDGFGLRAAVLSLDDLYLTRAERERLARDVHPLLRTRGVPGTHEAALGNRILGELRGAAAGERVRIPRFDKATDDRRPPEQCSEIEGPLDLLIFEGWCVGAAPQPAEALAQPINALERDEDRDGAFRRHVNAQLAGPYAALFRALDALVFLAVPELQSSLNWRIAQERELAARAPSGTALMSDAELARFVQHYERIARHMLEELPGRADVVLHLAGDHRCASLEFRERSARS